MAAIVKGTVMKARLFAVGLFLVLPLQAEDFSWRKTETSLALISGSNVIWQVVADPAQPKVYFHPLSTPSGTVLTDLSPKDHPWHRGLWWSWKFINGLNYWEEDPQGRSQGATELVETAFKPNPDGSAELEFLISYHPWDNPPLLKETRSVHVSPPANGSYELRWISEFTAVADVLLERTPLISEPNGVGHGGYAGLSLRLNAVARDWMFANSEGALGTAPIHGKPADWLRFSTGSNGPSVTVFDDPQNPRHPTLWYVGQEMRYLSPAFLFAKPLTLSTGEKMVLRYRIVVSEH